MLDWRTDLSWNHGMIRGIESGKVAESAYESGWNCNCVTEGNEAGTNWNSHPRQLRGVERHGEFARRRAREPDSRCATVRRTTQQTGHRGVRQDKVCSRCSVEQSVRATLTLCAQWIEPRGEDAVLVECHSGRADAYAHARRALTRTMPGTGPPSSQAGTPRSAALSLPARARRTSPRCRTSRAHEWWLSRGWFRGRAQAGVTNLAAAAARLDNSRCALAWSRRVNGWHRVCRTRQSVWDAPIVEPLKGGPKVLAFSKDREPAQPSLKPLKRDFFEQPLIVAHRSAPLDVVVTLIQGVIAAPLAANQAIGTAVQSFGKCHVIRKTRGVLIATGQCVVASVWRVMGRADRSQLLRALPAAQIAQAARTGEGLDEKGALA